jgi:hypothetical protein
MFRRSLSTRPSFDTNATSIGKRMEKVWMALLGAMINTLPSAKESRPRRPCRRLAESNAVISVPATIAP